MRSGPGKDFAARHWYRSSVVSMALIPAAAVFALLVALRRWLYRIRVLRSVRLPVPVIVVGNLTVGGTGKTPMVLWLARMLRQAGRAPGIVLRGYGGIAGRRQGRPRFVAPGGDAAWAGDEAVLLAERSGCPVWISPDRVAAATALIDAEPRCDVLICDDGLQHYRIARDFEIAIEDERGHGNGRLIPAGPLREPAFRGVDVTIVNAPDTYLLPARCGRLLRMRLVPGRMYRLGASAGDDEEVSVESLRGKRLRAAAGIGNPTRFFELLESMGIAAKAHAFPDHHSFTAMDLDFPDCDAILITEKDAVKCRRLGKQNLIVLSVDAQPDPELSTLIFGAIATSPLVRAKLPEMGA